MAACTRKGQPKGRAQVPLNGRIHILMQNGNMDSWSGRDLSRTKGALSSAHSTTQCYCRNGNLWRQTELTPHHVSPDVHGDLTPHKWFSIVYTDSLPLHVFANLYGTENLLDSWCLRWFCRLPFWKFTVKWTKAIKRYRQHVVVCCLEGYPLFRRFSASHCSFANSL